jgi:hypothetical protein
VLRVPFSVLIFLILIGFEACTAAEVEFVGTEFLILVDLPEFAVADSGAVGVAFTPRGWDTSLRMVPTPLEIAELRVFLDEDEAVPVAD